MEQRFCHSCGHPLTEDDLVCPWCHAEQTPDWKPPASDLRPDVPWRAVEAIPVWLISFFATVVIGIALAIAFDKDQVTAIVIVVNEVLLGGAVLVWIKLRYQAGTEKLALRGTINDAAVGVGVGVLGVVAASVVSAIVVSITDAISSGRVKAPEQIPLQQAPSSQLLALIGFGVIVAAPIAEEMFFRGFVFRALRRWASPRKAILISAAIFAAAHISPLLLPPIFVLGLMLASVVERRGTIVSSIAAHMTFNAWGFLLFVLSKR